MHRKAEGKAVVDYSFHVTLSDLNESTLREMPVMIDRGYTSFKMFTTYETLRVTDDVLLKALVQARTHGGLVCVHAENHHMIDYLVKEFQAAGKSNPNIML
ncbi:MAG: hypothetical protein ACOY3U_05240 [Bacillota bacterium]|nr:hypothetical protein [Desulforamulus profundi]